MKIEILFYMTQFLNNCSKANNCIFVVHVYSLHLIRSFPLQSFLFVMTSDILSNVGLMNVAKQLGNDWALVVGYLGLKQAEIEQIKMDNPYSTINQITIALQRWRDRQEGQADTILKQLFSALRSFDHTDLLEEIQEKYNITGKQLTTSVK